MTMTLEEIAATLLTQAQLINDLRQEVSDLSSQLATLTAHVLHSYEAFGDSAEQPPLDSSVIWMRGQHTATPPGYVQQILSLISEVSGDTAYPWPLYILLKTSHNQGDADGVTVRLIKNGNGWGTAYHAETFHDAGNNSTIGVNIEAHKGIDAGRSVGLNLQSIGWQMDGSIKETVIDEAINIQNHTKGTWQTGIHFDPVSEGERQGVRAIWIEGKWDVGIDAGSNSIRMNKGAELMFDETGRYYMKYNPDEGRIEFHNRGEEQDRVIGYIPADAPEHEL